MQGRLVIAALVIAGAVGYALARVAPPRHLPRPVARAPAAHRRAEGMAINWDSVGAARANLRRRIAAADTYLQTALSRGDSLLKRWPARPGKPLLVYAPPPDTSSAGFGQLRATHEAFQYWERSGVIPLQFRLVDEPAAAEVTVRWIERFSSQRRTGQADVEWDQLAWLRRGTLTLATHSQGGTRLAPDAVYAVALHEIGHLVGLGHSDSPADLMYPSTSVQALTERDRRSARLLYSLPPGSLRDPTAWR